MKKGDFRQLGAKVNGDTVVFTFNVGDIDDIPSICMFKKSTHELVKTIELNPTYKVGRTYSVELTDVNTTEWCYLYEYDESYHVDPYSTSIVGRSSWNDLSRLETGMQVYSGFDVLSEGWQDSKVQIKPMDMVMYQAHMRGFTMQHALSTKLAGNYLGFIKRLPYIKDLGVTSLELMPIYDFEEVFYERRQIIDKNGERSFQETGLDKVNYWGFGPGFYMAPKVSYFGENPVEGLREFVAAVHALGIELILDFSFDNRIEAEQIIDILEFYVLNYHIDGFRLIGNNCPVEKVAKSAILAETKIFCEGYDRQTLVDEKHKHLFIYDDGFLYVLRQMVNHMSGSIVQLSNHMRRQNDYFGFVNYGARVNGYTLMDSFSYGEKHNQANGEENKDGNNVSYSTNYGVEGSTRNKQIVSIRKQQVRNSLFATIMSQGVPLIVCGDERGNSAEGNNNPYCQDNSVGWVNFSKKKDSQELLEFTKRLIEFRKNHQCIRQENAFSMNDYKHVGFPDMSYHGTQPWLMGIGEEQRAFGVLISAAYTDEEEDVYLCYNFSYDEVELALPHLASGKRWRKAIDTVEFDLDLTPRPIDNQQTIKLAAQSCVALVGIKV